VIRGCLICLGLAFVFYFKKDFLDSVYAHPLLPMVLGMVSVGAVTRIHQHGSQQALNVKILKLNF
jgi:hypothetical protein